MKKLFKHLSLLMTLLLFATLSYAQSTHTIGFEGPDDGTGWAWTTAANGDDPALEFIANPDQSGLNTTDTVAKFTARSNGESFALVFTDSDGQFTFDADNDEVKIMVWKSRISDVAMKFEGGDAALELKVANTVTGQWEELTFDFSSVIGNTYSRMVIIPDFAARTEEQVVYFDNIQVPDGVVAGPLAEPTDAAPTPGVDGDDVVSIFSDAYTNIDPVDYNPNWGQSTVTTVESIGGNSAWKLSGLNYQGIDFDGNRQDVSAAAGFSTETGVMRFDYWTADSDSLRFFIIWDGGEYPYSVRPIALEEWVTVEVPLSYFVNNGADLSTLRQLKVDGSGTIWFDNILFSKVSPTTGGTQPTRTIGFEGPDDGTGWAWTTTANGDDPALEFIANPDQSGLNTTDTVAKFTARSNGEPYALVFTDDNGQFTFDADNDEVKIMVWKSRISDVAMKFEGGDAALELKVANTLTEQWEELTFDFSSVIGNTYSRMVIIPDFAARTEEQVVFFDNIQVPEGVVEEEEPLAEPTDAAPTPGVDPEDVVSIFSDAYTNIDPVDYNPNWGQSTVTTVESIGGNSAWKLSGLNYQGIDFDGNRQDVSAAAGFSTETGVMRFDYWTPNSDSLRFFVIWDGGEYPYSVRPIALEEWVTVEVPLSYFVNNGADLSTLRQLKVDGSGTIWFDNILFSKVSPTTGETVVGPVSPIDFESEASGTGFAWTVFANEADDPLFFIENPDQSGINTSNTVAEFIAKQNGESYAGTITKDVGVFTLDTSNAIVKIMVWKSVISDVGIKFEIDGASTGEIKVPNTLTNQWEEITFDFTGKIGEPTSTGINSLVIFPDFQDRSSDNTVYFDNITFNPVVPATVPTVAAPVPVVAEENVISIYSDTYENVFVDTWSAVWDNADVEDMAIEGDSVKKYSNLVFAGIEMTTNPIDATTMTHFHMDMWTPDNVTDPAVFKIKLVDFGADGQFAGGDDVEHEVLLNDLSTPALASGVWNSLDIPLSDFTGLTTRGAIAQLIISGDPNTVYVDNIYLYGTDTGISELDQTKPEAYGLSQNYPNPFNPSTRIQFQLKNAGDVKIKVLNLLGQEVMTLVNEYKAAGTYEVSVDASNLPSGTYLYSISSGSFFSVKKMVLIK